MVTITKEPKPRLEPILLSPEEQIEVQKIMTNSYRSSTRSTKMGKICGMCMCGSIPTMTIIETTNDATS